jgi:hypothetical protein
MMNTLWSLRNATLSLCIVVAMLVQGSSDAVAQTKTGTTIGQFLLIEPSARVAAMGNAGVATFADAQAGYFNPASWGNLANSDAQFTYGTWLAGIRYNHAAVSVMLGERSALGLTLTTLNSGDITVRTVQQPLGTGEKYEVTNTAIGVGYAARLTDRFSAGLLVSYVQESIWHSSLTVFAVNIGTLYRVTSEGMYIGASISNFGTRGSYSGTDLRIRFDNDASTHGDNSNLPGQVTTDEFSLPIVFRVGIAYPLTFPGKNALTLAVDAYHPSDNTESMSFGAEWKVMGLVSIRGGYQQVFQQDSEVGLTLGGGIDSDLLGLPVHVDYGWASHGRLGDVQRISVGMAF